VGLGELVDRLSIVNLKLFKVKDEQATSPNFMRLAKLAQDDIALCTERARLKVAIDALFGRVSGEVKLYG
jgi:hypothetical protein